MEIASVKDLQGLTVTEVAAAIQDAAGRDIEEIDNDEVKEQTHYDFYVFTDLWEDYNSESIDLEYDIKFPMIMDAYNNYLHSKFNSNNNSSICCMLEYLEYVKKKSRSRVTKEDLQAILDAIPDGEYIDLIVADANDNWNAVGIALNQSIDGNGDAPYNELVVTLENGYEVICSEDLL